MNNKALVARWGNIPPEFNYVAKDWCGAIYAYSKYPHVTGKIWSVEGQCAISKRLTADQCSDPHNVRWCCSVQERPAAVEIEPFDTPEAVAVQPIYDWSQVGPGVMGLSTDPAGHVVEWFNDGLGGWQFIGYAEHVAPYDGNHLHSFEMRPGFDRGVAA